MATETKSPKITYATMTADRMEDLHRELDAAIERVKSTFGKSHPMVIGGRDVRASSEFDDRSPIDTRILLGRFQSGMADHARDAIAAARAAFPAWSGRPWRERVALVKRGIVLRTDPVPVDAWIEELGNALQEHARSNQEAALALRRLVG